MGREHKTQSCNRERDGAPKTQGAGALLRFLKNTSNRATTSSDIELFMRLKTCKAPLQLRCARLRLGFVSRALFSLFRSCKGEVREDKRGIRAASAMQRDNRGNSAPSPPLSEELLKSHLNANYFGQFINYRSTPKVSVDLL